MIPVMAFPSFARGLLHFPWRLTFLTLRQRFREDRLGLSASSLTFTTSIALVPFFTVVLAVFTVFPAFGKMQEVLQVWLIESLVPDHLTRQVMGHLSQFTRQASRLGGVGLALLVLSATVLMLTIDRTLNAIWRVPRSRPLPQRLLVYWAAITLGPLLLAASLAATAQALTLFGLGKASSRSLAPWLDAFEFLLHAAALTALFRFMPNTHVRWTHAAVGGLLAAAGLALAKVLLAAYLKAVPSYSLVYGAFATAPILLIWIYLVWLVVLMGAVISAYLPSLVSGQAGRAVALGEGFTTALSVLRLLLAARTRNAPGLSSSQMAQALELDRLHLEPVLQTLRRLAWAAPIEPLEEQEALWVLLADPQRTPIAPLVQALLLERHESSERFWQESRWESVSLRSVL